MGGIWSNALYLPNVSLHLAKKVLFAKWVVFGPNR